MQWELESATSRVQHEILPAQQKERAVADLFCTVGWALVQHVVKQRMSPKHRKIIEIDGNLGFHQSPLGWEG